MNGYELTRRWYNYKFENPDKVKSIHSDFYFYIIDLWNRLGQKEKFGLPTSVTMEILNVGSRNTYSKVVKDLVEFGFIRIVSTSKNQHQSMVIALSNIEQASEQALEQAHIQASEQTPEQSCEQTPEHIIEQKTTNKKQQTKNKERGSRFTPPSLFEVEQYVLEKNFLNVNAKAFWNFYESKNWYVGRNKMKDWHRAVAGWESRTNEKNNNNGKTGQSTGAGQYRVSDNLKRKILDRLQPD